MFAGTWEEVEEEIKALGHSDWVCKKAAKVYSEMEFGKGRRLFENYIRNSVHLHPSRFVIELLGQMIKDVPLNDENDLMECGFFTPIVNSDTKEDNYRLRFACGIKQSSSDEEGKAMGWNIAEVWVDGKIGGQLKSWEEMQHIMEKVNFIADFPEWIKLLADNGHTEFGFADLWVSGKIGGQLKSWDEVQEVVRKVKYAVDKLEDEC